MESSETKGFKCADCDATFSTADNLQVHQRRHEMSLNLSLKPSASTSLLTPSFLNKGSISAGIIGFVDETPTPTRFIRNCEEVGLFQDLQNVNPFDEDFKKAASSATGTPSGEGNAFDFSFAGAGGLVTPTLLRSASSSISKRRYSEQDSLNTPQVFPYVSITSGYHLQTLTTNTASMSACLTPTPQNSVISQASLRNVLQIETPTTPTTTYNHEEHVSIIAYTSVISQQKNKSGSHKDEAAGAATTPLTGGLVGARDAEEKSPSCQGKSKSPATELMKSPKPLSPSKTVQSPSTGSESHMGSRISLLKIRSKANLKLDLKTVISRSQKATHGSSRGIRSPTTSTGGTSSEVGGGGKGQSKREILERKRAASHRSRERRKQWIYGLESKCRELETFLAQSQAEIVHLKAENANLQRQLQDTSKSTGNEAEPHQITTLANSYSSSLMSPSKAKLTYPPIFMDQSCQTEISLCIQDQAAKVERMSSNEIMTARTLPLIVLPTVKAKRGRPRKGQERRVPIISVPSISPSDEIKTQPKIPILPLPNRRQLLVNRKV